jgi:large subunit ribosomal protein L29
MKENADRARALDANELAKQLRDTAEQMFRLRFQMSMGQMEGVKKYRSLRKERARMLTVIQQRASGDAAPVASKTTAQSKTKTKATGMMKKAATPKPASKPVVKSAGKSAPAAKKIGSFPKTAKAVAQKPRKSSKG